MYKNAFRVKVVLRVNEVSILCGGNKINCGIVSLFSIGSILMTAIGISFFIAPILVRFLSVPDPSLLNNKMIV